MDEHIGESDIQWMHVEVQRYGELGGLCDVDMVEVEQVMVRNGSGSDILQGHRRHGQSGITWNDELEGMIETREQIELSSCPVEDGE